MLALWSMEIIDGKQIKVKDKRRERPRPLATKQDEKYYWYQCVSREGETYQISTATKAVCS